MAANDTVSRVNRMLGYAAFITTGVLTAVFVQKSDGNSTIETVTLLGAASVGAFLVAAAFASHVYLFDPQPHRLSWYLSRRPLSVIGGLFGIILIGFSMASIDKEDSDFGQPPVFHQDGGSTTDGAAEVVTDGDSIALRNLVVSSNSDVVRMVVSVVNTSKAPVVFSSATWTNAGPPTAAGICTGPERYSLEGEVQVDAKGTAHAELLAEEGPLAGVPVQAAGIYANGCDGFQEGIHLEFPISMDLNPLEATSFTLDIHKNAHLLRDASADSGDASQSPLEYTNARGWITKLSIGYGVEGSPDRASVCLPGSVAPGDPHVTAPRNPCKVFGW